MRDFVFGCFSFFFYFVFHAKSGTANNYWTGLSDISHYSRSSRDSNDLKKFPNNFLSVEKNLSGIFGFSSIFD